MLLEISNLSSSCVSSSSPGSCQTGYTERPKPPGSSSESRRRRPRTMTPIISKGKVTLPVKLRCRRREGVRVEQIHEHRSVHRERICAEVALLVIRSGRIGIEGHIIVGHPVVGMLNQQAHMGVAGELVIPQVGREGSRPYLHLP